MTLPQRLKGRRLRLQSSPQLRDGLWGRVTRALAPVSSCLSSGYLPPMPSAVDFLPEKLTLKALEEASQGCSMRATALALQGSTK